MLGARANAKAPRQLGGQTVYGILQYRTHPIPFPLFVPVPKSPLLKMEVDQQEFFIVQKCWFDGPHVEAPVDYMALFRSRGQAEEVAYHSAHVHATQRQAVVRTLLLATGYAFSTAGKLFWVRSVYARGGGDGQNGGCAGGAIAAGAHVILNGVIGGTGNANSRRGSEVARNRVFIGHDSATRAMQVLQSENLPRGTVVTFIPMGPLANLGAGWSGGGSRADLHNNNPMAVNSNDSPTKRSTMDGQPQQQFHYHVTSARPAKRHRCVLAPGEGFAAATDVFMSG